jgi:hypothetical protein
MIHYPCMSLFCAVSGIFHLTHGDRGGWNLSKYYKSSVKACVFIKMRLVPIVSVETQYIAFQYVNILSFSV